MTTKLISLANVIALLLVLTLPTRPARAVGTDPTLTLTTAEVFTSANGIVSVTVFGTYSFDDLMQFSFPAGLVAFQGTRFIRYDFDGSVAAEGTVASLQDGLSAAEIPAVRSTGSAASPPAVLTHLSAGKVQVVLSGFQPGTVSLVIYAILEGTPFVSNTLTVTLP